MKKYEYKFVEVVPQKRFKDKAGDTFDECKKIILAQAQDGWRFKQVVTPFNEKIGVYGAVGYQIIFEKELSSGGSGGAGSGRGQDYSPD